MPDHPEVSIVPRWLTKAMAARYLTMSETTFEDNIKRGAFPAAIRLPTGSLKWDRLDLDAAMERLKAGLLPANDAGVRNVPYVPREGRRALPKGVHRVVSRKREYFYWQPFRNTPAAGPRVRLPDNTRSPEFWAMLARLQGTPAEPVVITMNMVFDKYMQWLRTRNDVGGETKRKYEKTLDLARQRVGHMRSDDMRPADIRVLLDQFADVPGTGNNLLGALRAVSSGAWREVILTTRLPNPLSRSNLREAIARGLRNSVTPLSAT